MIHCKAFTHKWFVSVLMFAFCGKLYSSLLFNSTVVNYRKLVFQVSTLHSILYECAAVRESVSPLRCGAVLCINNNV
jgi:hypothetical protein